MLTPAFLDQLDDPPRIKIEAETDPAAYLAEMLDAKPQASRAGGAQHQPVAAGREMLVGERFAEKLVVGAEVLAVDASFRDTGSAASLEDVDGLAGEPLGN